MTRFVARLSNKTPRAMITKELLTQGFLSATDAHWLLCVTSVAFDLSAQGFVADKSHHLSGAMTYQMLRRSTNQAWISTQHLQKLIEPLSSGKIFERLRTVVGSLHQGEEMS